MRMGEKCMNKVRQSKAINKKTKKIKNKMVTNRNTGGEEY